MAMAFEPEKLQLEKLIGQGTFGAVYKGDYDGQKVAVKIIGFEDDHNEKAAFLREATVWSKLDHPNVAKFLGATKVKLKATEKWGMVAEFLEGGTLFSYLGRRNKKKLPFNMVIRLALDVARGLAYLHSQKVVHRDVKTNNMVLDGEQRVKLIDFGVSRKEATNPSEMTGNTGTAHYMAPEVLAHNPYDHKCDVFSFGICLWEIFHCRKVETHMCVRPVIRDNCPQKLADLMRECWGDPNRRPEMAEVVKTLEEMSASEDAKSTGDRSFKGCISLFRR